MIYTGQYTIFNHSQQELLGQMIKEQEILGGNIQEGKRSFSHRLAKFLSTSSAKDILDIINTIFSISMATGEAINTYNTAPEGNSILKILFIIFTLFFIMDLILNIYISENKFMFVLKTTTILEYVTNIPQFLYFTGIVKKTDMISFSRILRFLLAYKIERVFARHSMELIRHSFKVFFTFFAIILINSAFLFIVEDEGISILDYYYFMIVTMSTVGFGDIVAKTTIGRFSVISSLFIILAVLPGQIDGLSRVIRLRSKFARIKFQKSDKAQDHIIILGANQKEALEAFLKELYHSDHGVIETYSLLMHYQITDEIKEIISIPKYAQKVMFLQGSALIKKDLDRCKAVKAKCFILIANKKYQNAIQEDHKNILYAFSIKNYVQNLMKRDIRICLQLIRPQNKELYSRLFQSEIDQVICVEELKLYLLAKSCLCPGICTIVSFLIQSKKPQFNEQQYDPFTQNWMDEYRYGMQNEIYRIPLESEVYEGISFNIVSNEIYKQLHYIVVAVEVEVEGTVIVLVNPTDYIFNDTRHFCYLLANQIPNVEEFSTVVFGQEIKRNYNFESIKQKRHNLIKKQIRIKIDSTNFSSEQNEMKSFYYMKIGTPLQNQYSHQEMFENHIIICGMTSNLKNILFPLRSKTLEIIYPVVILHHNPIPTEIWKQINKFPKVYFIQGDPLKIQDLEKIQIQKALSVIILQKQFEQSEDQETSLIDADTIFIYKIIKLANPSIRIITELASIQAISFMSFTKNILVQKFGYIVSEIFASGEIYISTMLDTLLCQAYYNPFITNILFQFIMGNSSFTNRERKRNQNHKLESSNLFMIYLPAKFNGKMFGQFFEYLCLEKKMIAIGIHRGVNSKKNAKPYYQIVLNNKYFGSYVYLKPKFNVILTSNDMVYVLSPRQPKEFDPNIMENERIQNLYKERNQMDFTIKSKLLGHEGKIDVDIARQLNKINVQFKTITNQLKMMNHSQFDAGFENQNFIPQVKQALRAELAKKY